MEYMNMQTIQECRLRLAELARQERELQKQQLQVLLQIAVLVNRAAPGAPKLTPAQIKNFNRLMEDLGAVAHDPLSSRVSIALALNAAQAIVDSFE